MAGAKDSGKTTLIASLYEQFLAGPFCDLSFAGSITLVGLEQRAFDARMDSGREEADTPRTTTAEGFKVLHLCLASKVSPERQHLLLGDLSGEWYRLARESLSDALELQYIRRADYLCLLIDGERLLEPTERHQEVGNVEGTMRSLLEAGILGPQSRLDLVCSKWDLVHGDSAAIAFLDDRVDRIIRSVGELVAELNSGRVAARPRDGNGAVPFGLGLDTLLRRWTAPKPPLQRIDIGPPDRGLLDREFARLARRF
jgi:hypothetical protein